MIKFLGENWYIDINEIEKTVSLDSSFLEVSDSGSTEPQISVTRYEIIKSLIEVLLTEREELDDNLGIHGSKNLTIPFKIAFNTLLINNILKNL
jgi:hypothetical protein